MGADGERGGARPSRSAAIAGPVVDEFVGRRRELDRLIDRLARLGDGEGALVFVAGEPGIGKTRLGLQLTRAAEDAGVGVRWGHCWEEGAAPSFWPWLQVLAGPAEGDRDLRRERIAEPESSIDLQLSASRRIQFFDRMVQGLRALAPTVVVLDDVHRADRPSLELLRHVASQLPRLDALIVVTVRDTELDAGHPISELLADVADHPACEYLQLGSLEPGEALARMRALGAGALDEAQLEALVSRSGGNPFFLEELVRAGADAWSGAVPRPVREVIRRRLLALPDQARAALVACAVLGRSFDAAVAARLLGASPAGLIDTIGPAFDARLVEGEGRPLRFLHALVHEVALAELDARSRTAAHRRAVDALVATPGLDEDLRAELVAHHAIAAESGGAAIDASAYALTAARRAERRFAYESAADLYSAALEVGSGGPRRAELLVGLGDALVRAGQAVRARATFELAADEAAADDGPALARAALGIGACVVTAGFVDWLLVGRLEQALAASAPDVSACARLRSRLGIELYWHGGGDEARAISERALADAEAADDRTSLVEALFARLFTLRGPGRLDQRLEIGHRLVELAARDELADAETRGRIWLIPELLQAGEVTGYRAHVATLAERARASGQPLYRWYAAMYHAQEAALFARPDEAEVLSCAAHEEGARVGAAVSHAYRASQRMWVARDIGGLDAALPELLSAIAAFPAFRTLRAMLALTQVELGRLDEARLELDRLAADDFGDIPPDSLWIATMVVLAEVAHAVGSKEAGSRLAELLAPFSGLCAVQGLPTCVGAVDRGIAFGLLAAGDVTGALEHFDRAVELHERWGFRALSARVRAERARALLIADRPTDGAAAQADIAVASGIARELGLTALRMPHARRAAAGISGPGGVLSPRETEVLSLIAAGASNPSIATQLVVSINTVERHVTNILRKLGVSTRTAAAAVAVRQGIDAPPDDRRV